MMKLQLRLRELEFWEGARQFVVDKFVYSYERGQFQGQTAHRLSMAIVRSCGPESAYVYIFPTMRDDIYTPCIYRWRLLGRKRMWQ